MSDLAFHRLPMPKSRHRNLIAIRTTSDLVNRDFTVKATNQLWVTDITEHTKTWIPRIDAALAYLFSWSRAYKRSAAVFQLSAFRGRALSSLATC